MTENITVIAERLERNLKLQRECMERILKRWRKNEKLK